MSVNDGLDPDRPDDEPRKKRDRDKSVDDREIIVNTDDALWVRRRRKADEKAGFDLEKPKDFDALARILRRQRENAEARDERRSWLTKLLLTFVTIVFGTLVPVLLTLTKEAFEWVRSFVK